MFDMFISTLDLNKTYRELYASMSLAAQTATTEQLMQDNKAYSNQPGYRAPGIITSNGLGRDYTIQMTGAEKTSTRIYR